MEITMSLCFLAGLVLGLRSVPTNNLSTRMMDWTQTLVVIFKNILSSTSKRLSTAFQEHGTDSIYCFFFFCYKYNFFSKKFTTSVQVFKKKCKSKTSVSWVCLLLILVKHNKWSLSVLPCPRSKLQWVACCDSDNSSGVGTVYCHLYLPPPNPCFLSASFPAH